VNDDSHQDLNATINEIKKGSEKSFKKFYEDNSPSLRYFATKYLNDTDLINDIIQDAFVIFWKNRAKIKDYNSAKSYLYSIVKNMSLNRIKHAKVKQKYIDNMPEEDNSNYLNNILEAEILDLILKFFNELPPACKNVYRLSLNGLSHKEISEKLNISINTVKKHKNKANHFIKERIGKILDILLLISI